MSLNLSLLIFQDLLNLSLKLIHLSFNSGNFIFKIFANRLLIFSLNICLLRNLRFLNQRLNILCCFLNTNTVFNLLFIDFINISFKLSNLFIRISFNSLRKCWEFLKFLWLTVLGWLLNSHYSKFLILMEDMLNLEN